MAVKERILTILLKLLMLHMHGTQVHMHVKFEMSNTNISVLADINVTNLNVKEQRLLPN